MEALQQMFDTLKPLLQVYSPPFTPKKEEATFYDLWSLKSIVIDGRKHKEVYFAGLITQKSYLGFYFMPVYIETELKNVFSPELLKLLKGKSCFHIKKLDQALVEQIQSALKHGFELYQDRGWV